MKTVEEKDITDNIILKSIAKEIEEKTQLQGFRYTICSIIKPLRSF